MHQVLYRKHRPRSFDEVVGQDHVVGAIQNSFKLGRVAHAYLFSGPRGVGKTTMARLIAKALNCTGSGDKPCNACDFCTEFNEGRAPDLAEIDAASNRGIDEIRELREGVRFVPSKGKYKCYIIDEVHMLTPPAFNALLKTLEEPPSHAVFVLATTEVEKVPETIVSRTQRYDFHRPKPDDMVSRLLQVAKKENVSLDDDAARIIAIAATGSMRDAESMLGKVMAVSDEKISREHVEAVLGLPSREATKRLFELIVKKETTSALALIQEIVDGGYEAPYIMKSLIQYFRNALFLKIDPSLKSLLAGEMLHDEWEVIGRHLPNLERDALARSVSTCLAHDELFKTSPIPQLPLELAVVELTVEQPKEV